jgi:hypothetical protein
MKRGKESDDKRKKNVYKSWREIKELFGIVQVVQGHIIPDAPDIIPDNLQNIMQEILWKWNQRASLFEFPGKNEDEREDYVKDILLSVVPKGGNLAITTQYPVKNKEYGDPFDIVIYALTPSEMPVIYIVEAKMNDIEQGRAQLYPQLKVCYELAKKKENWDNPIYGAISTVMNWVFVRYNGKKWVELEPLAVNTPHDQAGIQKVVKVLYKIILHQQNLIQDVVKKYSTEEDQ